MFDVSYQIVIISHLTFLFDGQCDSLSHEENTLRYEETERALDNPGIDDTLPYAMSNRIHRRCFSFTIGWLQVGVCVKCGLFNRSPEDRIKAHK